MPRMGRPSWYTSGSGWGAPASYTEAGPPLKINPRGARRRTSSAAMSPGTSSQYTLASRTRRAISWLYCEPKSRTSTVSWAVPGRVSMPEPVSTAVVIAVSPPSLAASHPHPDPLLALLQLALGLDRRGHHHLRVLKLADGSRSAHSHRALQRADQIHAAVVDVGRPEEHLAEGALDPGADARTPRQVGIGGRHAPVIAVSGRLLGAGEDRSDHHRVGAAGEGLADVAADAHPAIGDDRDPLPAAPEVVVAGGGAVAGGGHLGDADAQHRPGGAGGPGTDAHQQAADAGVHQLQRGRVVDAVADDHGNVERVGELAEGELLVGAADVAGGEHGALDDEHVGAGLLDDGATSLGVVGDRRDRTGHPAFLDLLDALSDQPVLHRCSVELLQQDVDVLRRRGGDLGENRAGILVTGLHPVEVENRETPVPAHLVDEVDVDHSVHRRGQDGELETATVEAEAD